MGDIPHSQWSGKWCETSRFLDGWKRRIDWVRISTATLRLLGSSPRWLMMTLVNGMWHPGVVWWIPAIGVHQQSHYCLHNTGSTPHTQPNTSQRVTHTFFIFYWQNSHKPVKWNHLKARQAQATDSAWTWQHGTKKDFPVRWRTIMGWGGETSFGTLGCVRIDTELKDGDEIDANKLEIWFMQCWKCYF